MRLQTFTYTREPLHRSLIALAITVTVLSLHASVVKAAPDGPASENAPLPHITWHVVNPFRFFNDAKDLEPHRHAYRWLTETEQQNPVLSIERKLATKQPGGWAADVVDATCWDRKRNRHFCPDGTNYIQPKEHVVEASLSGVPSARNLTGVDCDWRMETVTRHNVPPKVQTFTAACQGAVKVAIPYPHGAKLTVMIGSELLARDVITVTDLFIVGMGDSFASGEGNPDKPVRFSGKRTADYGTLGEHYAFAGYPARVGQWREVGDELFLKSGAEWLDRACHRSLYSHQMRAALQLSLEHPHRAVTFVGVACSGAQITHGLFLRYKGNEWVINPPDLSQISAVAQAQCGARNAPERDFPEAYHMLGRIVDLEGGLVLRKCPVEHARKIDLLFLSIGGNDIGFARLVANAVLRDETVLKRLGGWFGEVFDPDDVVLPMKELEARYKSLDRALHNILHIPWNKRGRVILTAYPGMALLEDGRRVCPDGRLGMDVLPQYSLNAKRALDGEKVGEALYHSMRRAAAARGWRVAGTHRAKFLGRGICAGADGASVTAADELRLPRKINGYWDPYNPQNYEPYTSRRRWFRTPNDAYMTGNFHVRGAILRRLLRSRQLQWTQLLLASTYSGAFHPTAEGQAAMADAVVRKARAVLEGSENPISELGRR